MVQALNRERHVESYVNDALGVALSSAPVALGDIWIVQPAVTSLYSALSSQTNLSVQNKLVLVEVVQQVEVLRRTCGVIPVNGCSVDVLARPSHIDNLGSSNG